MEYVAYQAWLKNNWFLTNQNKSHSWNIAQCFRIQFVQNLEFHLSYICNGLFCKINQQFLADNSLLKTLA